MLSRSPRRISGYGTDREPTRRVIITRPSGTYSAIPEPPLPPATAKSAVTKGAPASFARLSCRPTTARRSVTAPAGTRLSRTVRASKSSGPTTAPRASSAFGTQTVRLGPAMRSIWR